MSRRDQMLWWYPVLLRYGGLVGGLVFVPLVWYLTDRINPSLIAFFTLMLGLGEGTDALRDFIQSKPIPPTLPTPKPREGESP